MGRRRRIAAVLVLCLAAFVYLNNTSLLSPRPSDRPVLLAHRGMAQRFDTAA